MFGDTFNSSSYNDNGQLDDEAESADFGCEDPTFWFEGQTEKETITVKRSSTLNQTVSLRRLDSKISQMTEAKL